jgi:hypothetical protein
MTAKTVNYTAEQTAAVVADYKAGVAVESIAAAVGKSVRSVVAKLSREGVYKAKERTTKSGDAIVKKDNLADELAMLVGLTEAEATSLAKVNKTALVKLLALAKATTLTDANDVS